MLMRSISETQLRVPYSQILVKTRASVVGCKTLYTDVKNKTFLWEIFTNKFSL